MFRRKALLWTVGVFLLGSAVSDAGPGFNVIRRPESAPPPAPPVVQPKAPIAPPPAPAGQAPAAAPVPVQNPPPSQPVGLGIQRVSVPSLPPDQGVSAATDDPSQSLLERQRQIQAQVEELNRKNPMSESFEMNAIGPTGPIKVLLESPMMQGYLKVMGNQEALTGMSKIIQHPKRMYVIYTNIAVFIAFLFFRALRQSKAEKWFGRLWVSLYSMVLLWIVSILVVPTYFLGSDYHELIHGIYDGLTKVLKK